jgi:hypothetical protein
VFKEIGAKYGPFDLSAIPVRKTKQNTPSHPPFLFHTHNNVLTAAAFLN